MVFVTFEAPSKTWSFTAITFYMYMQDDKSLINMNNFEI